jgi:kinetochore protein Mis12/MTW1
VGTAPETPTDNPTHHPITDTTSFTLSQLPHLQSLLASVRPSLATLSATTVATPDGTSDERKQYIETQTKRHLQVTQGLELGMQGEVRDGEWQGRGLRPGEAQVRDLEMVVGMIGGRGDAGEKGKSDEVEKMDEGE